MAMKNSPHRKAYRRRLSRLASIAVAGGIIASGLGVVYPAATASAAVSDPVAEGSMSAKDFA
ncbi:hypothetical protein, partial [Streptomyces sp. NPDC049949]|uniref:hypothetical protein n=1 Tax=unclassified Streptomyces TaxID=2593676 RepID=UPI003416DFBA